MWTTLAQVQRQGGRGNRGQEEGREEARATRTERASRDDERRGRPAGGRDRRDRRSDPTSDFESDWAGRLMLERYLAGEGTWRIRNEPRWTWYMKDSDLLRTRLEREVVDNATRLQPGPDGVVPLSWSFHGELENGEGIIGYQYLHGTNRTVGDFQVSGTADVRHHYGQSLVGGGVSSPGTAVTMRMTYVWNDVIDPNPQYGTDTFKSIVAEILTLGEAEGYEISIGWDEECEVWFPDVGPPSVIGYPGTLPRTRTPPTVPVFRDAGQSSGWWAMDPAAARGVLAAVSGEGDPLPTSVREDMEARLGQPFDDVRVHTGATASASARVLNAKAYTVGSHIAFDHGSFGWDTAGERVTLAHELAHVVQQRHGRVDGAGSAPGMTVSDPGDHFERQAQAIAERAVGSSVPAASHVPPGVTDARRIGGAASSAGSPRIRRLTVQRFGSGEHVRIGAEALPGQQVLLTGFGQVDYGEMIALGDYFESLDEMNRLVSSFGEFGRAQIAYALWKVNPGGRSRPPSNPSAEGAVEDRYYRLAASNETHFSTGSTSGRSNRERYIALHTEALSLAWWIGLNPLVPRPWNWEAQEAFAAHFLTDAFAAGHVRTPRGDIQRHWNGLYPAFRDNLVATISCWMAAYINDQHGIGWVQTVDGLAALIAPEIRARAGPVLAAFAIGDLIAKVMHDADNAGLDVESQAGLVPGTGPTRWRAVGDEHLFPAVPNAAATTTAAMAEQAVRLSFEEGQRARATGSGAPGSLSALTNPASFRALALIPHEDPTSTTNQTYGWRAASASALPASIRALILQAFTPHHEIREGLDAIVVPPVTSVGPLDLPTGPAWTCFKNALLADPMAMIEAIASGRTCPPGKNNPCP